MRPCSPRQSAATVFVCSNATVTFQRSAVIIIKEKKIMSSAAPPNEAGIDLEEGEIPCDNDAAEASYYH